MYPLEQKASQRINKDLNYSTFLPILQPKNLNVRKCETCSMHHSCKTVLSVSNEN